MRQLIHKIVDFLHLRLKTIKWLFYLSLVCFIFSEVAPFYKDKLELSEPVGYFFYEINDTIIHASMGEVRTFDESGLFLEKWDYDEETGTSTSWIDDGELVILPHRGDYLLFYNSRGDLIKKVNKSNRESLPHYELHENSLSERFKGVGVFYHKIYDEEKGDYITSLRLIDYFVLTPWILFLGLFGGLLFLATKVKKLKDESENRRKLRFDDKLNEARSKKKLDVS